MFEEFLKLKEMSSHLEVLLSSEDTGQMWNMCVWDPSTGSTLKTYKGNATKAKTAGFISNTFLISGQPSKPLLNVWRLDKHEQQPLKYITPGVLQAMCPSPCGHYLVGTVAERIYLWQTCNGKLLKLLTNGHYQKINVVRFTADGSQFVTGGEDGNLLVWFLNSDLPRFSWSHHSLGITGIHIGHGDAFTSRIFTSSKDQTSKVYCLNSGQLLLDIEFTSILTSITIDSAEELGFVGDKDGLVQSFSLKHPPRDLKMKSLESEEHCYKGHTANVTCLTASLDGQMLASGSEDCSVRLWHVASHQCLRVLPHKGVITTLFFMLPKPGMLVLDDFQADRTLALLEKTVMPDTKNLLKNDIFSLEIITNDDTAKEEQGFEEPSARDLLGIGISTQHPILPTSIENDPTDEDDQIKVLKSTNQKLYQAAVKAILKE